MITRFISKYTWGPMGPISRKGVRVDGDPPYEMCTYNLCGDAMGNTVGVVDAHSGAGQTQTFDAFGNLEGSYALTACAGDPSPRMAAGNLQWRGGEGSRTPQLSRDRIEDENGVTSGIDPVQVDEAFTRASCGLVYMNARFYDPATGRFTQKDPVPHSSETILVGQTNRWVYAANDPVNLTDLSGEQLSAPFFGIGAASLLAGLLVMAALFALAVIAALLLAIIAALSALYCWINTLNKSQLITLLGAGAAVIGLLLAFVASPLILLFGVIVALAFIAVLIYVEFYARADGREDDDLLPQGIPREAPTYALRRHTRGRAPPAVLFSSSISA